MHACLTVLFCRMLFSHGAQWRILENVHFDSLRVIMDARCHFVSIRWFYLNSNVTRLSGTVLPIMTDVRINPNYDKSCPELFHSVSFSRHLMQDFCKAVAKLE